MSGPYGAPSRVRTYLFVRVLPVKSRLPIVDIAANKEVTNTNADRESFIGDTPLRSPTIERNLVGL